MIVLQKKKLIFLENEKSLIRRIGFETQSLNESHSDGHLHWSSISHIGHQY